jgi:hypothetical protein
MDPHAQLFDYVAKLQNALVLMQTAGKVDESIDDTFEQIVTDVSRSEQFWNQAQPSPSNFAVYHAWRNLRLLFNRMRNRFANAELVHDNPLIVDQAREVVPKILSLLAMLLSVEDEPTLEKSSELMQHVRRLRSTARIVQMTEPEAELSEVEQKNLVDAFDRLLEPMTTASSNEA